VSRIRGQLDEAVGAFRTRRLEHIEFPLRLSGRHLLHVRNPAAQATSIAVVIATGITGEGGREVLGLDVGDSANEMCWRGFRAR
jgi:putative transposase